MAIKVSRRARRFGIRLGFVAGGLLALLGLGAGGASADLLGGTSQATQTVCNATANLTNQAGTLGGIAQFVVCNPGSLTFQVYTVYKRPDGTLVKRSTPGVIGAPVLVNATGTNQAVPTGTLTVDGLEPEIQVQMRPEGTDSLAALRFVVTLTGGGPSTFPVSVEAVLTPPATLNLPRHSLSYGYDATNATAPDSWYTVFSFGLTNQFSGDPVIGWGFDGHFPDQPNGTILGIGSHDTASHIPLTIVGGTWDGTPDNRINPIAGRIGFAPMPNAQTQFNITLGKTAITMDSSMNPHTGLLGLPVQFIPPVMTADFSALFPTPNSTATDSITAHSAITTLPMTTHVVFDQPHSTTPRNDTMDVSYTASAPINDLSANFNATRANDLPITASVDITGLPTYMAFHQGPTAPACSGGASWDWNLERCAIAGIATGQVTAASQPESHFTTTPPSGTILARPSGPIGSIDGKFMLGTVPATVTPPVTIPAGGEGATLVQYKTPGSGNVGNIAGEAVVRGLSDFRYLGAQPADAAAGTNEEPTSVHVVHQGGAFAVGVRSLDTTLPDLASRDVKASVSIPNFPSVLNFQYFPDEPKIHYDDNPDALTSGPRITQIVANVDKRDVTNANVPHELSGRVEIDGIPNSIDGTIVRDSSGKPIKFVWNASGNVDKVDVTLNGLRDLGAPINWADATVKSVPPHFEIGLNLATGVGLLGYTGPGNGPIGEIALHAGDSATQAQGIQTPDNRNTIYAVQYDTNAIRADLRLFNLQEAWASQDANNVTAAHLKLNRCPGATPQPSQEPVPFFPTAVDNSVASAGLPAGAPCPIVAAMPIWNGNRALYGATTQYIANGSQGAPGTSEFTGIQATWAQPIAGIDLTLTPKAGTGRPGPGSGDGTQINWYTYALCVRGTLGCPTGFTGGSTTPPSPIILRMPSLSGQTSTGYTVSALDGTVSNLPQTATICVGGGACEPAWVRGHDFIQKSSDGTIWYAPPAAIVHFTSNGDAGHPLTFNLHDCSGEVPTANWASGICDNWSDQTRFQRFDIANLSIPNHVDIDVMGGHFADPGPGYSQIDAVGAHLFFDTSGQPITADSVTFETPNNDFTAFANGIGFEATAKDWSAYYNGITDNSLVNSAPYDYPHDGTLLCRLRQLGFTFNALGSTWGYTWNSSGGGVFAAVPDLCDGAF